MPDNFNDSSFRPQYWVVIHQPDHGGMKQLRVSVERVHAALEWFDAHKTLDGCTACTSPEISTALAIIFKYGNRVRLKHMMAGTESPPTMSTMEPGRKATLGGPVTAVTAEDPETGVAVDLSGFRLLDEGYKTIKSLLDK